MVNKALQESKFEREKNIKAGVITLLFAALVFIVFYFLHWATPVTPPPIAETGIEVNLGNSEDGMGDVSPHSIGNPAEAIAPENATTSTSKPDETPEPINSNSNNEEDVDVGNNAKTKKLNNKPTDNTANKTEKTKQPATATLPINKPKALMGKNIGGKDNGGNDDKSFSNSPNQGNGNKPGDKGVKNGNPITDSYNGNNAIGKSGIAVKSGFKGRKINHYPEFKDDFDESGKVLVDITVDDKGKVIAASINRNGSTISKKSMWDIALRKAKELVLNPATEETETGTIVITFKLNGD